jgi:nucleotide-binding universal stress UspA family protein
MSQETEHGNRPMRAARRSPRVVVGVDGSPGSRAALVHAFAAAARRGAVLEVVATWSVQAAWGGGYPMGVPAVATVRDEVETRVRALVEEVRRDPAVSVEPGTADVRTVLVVSVGPASKRLVEASGSADLLVVGSRGRGGVRSALLGSVALHCVTHAACPVVVVHPTPPGRPRSGKVLVGVDGSAASRVALAAAVDEAASAGAEVAVVTTYPMADHWTHLSTVVMLPEQDVRDDLQRGAEEMVDEVLAERRTARPRPAPDVRVVVTEGSAAEVLLRWAADVDLLVVGSRGHGEFRGLLLGSVALACAMHGPCPVLVVHPPGDRAAVPVAEPAGAGV